MFNEETGQGGAFEGFFLSKCFMQLAENWHVRPQRDLPSVDHFGGDMELQCLACVFWYFRAHTHMVAVNLSREPRFGHAKAGEG